MVDFDINKICRVCLQSDIELSLLFNELNSVDGVCLSDMITECTMYTVQRHDDFPHLICDECIERVRNAYRFKKQFEKSHRKLITFLDSVNKVVIDTKFNNSVDKSIQTEETTLYPCEKCEKKFMNYQSLRDHRLDSHKGTANENFTAQDAGSSFASNYDGGHYDDNTNPFSIDEEDEKPLSALQNLKKAEGNDLDLNGHLVKMEPSDIPSLTMESYECQTPDYAMAKKPYQKSEPYQRIENGRYKCAECEKTFSKSSHVKRHFLSHTREKPFSCTICGKEFARADHCRNHVFRHDDEKVFPCDSCDRFYDCLEDLQRHTDQMHKAAMSHFAYGKFSEDAMKKAVSLVNDGMSLRKASAECEIAFQTLARYVKKAAGDKEAKMTPNYSVNKIFSNEQEIALVDYIIMCSRMYYGLPILECRKLAYEMAIANNVKIPRNWEREEMAGLHWFINFRKRHPILSLRIPEGYSLSRATSFSRHNVEIFFTSLKNILSRSPTCFDYGNRIYNLDETDTTIVQKPKKVIAERCMKQVSKVASAELGTLVTTCFTISATGQFIPPVMIFPRTHFKDHIIAGAPSGTLGLANDTGGMKPSSFVTVIDHFRKFTNSSKKNPTLLIIDNHESHINIAALNLAKENGITILTVPPHCTNKLQPLDVGVYGPFKTAYNAAVDRFMMQNPGETLNIYNVAESVGYAFEKSMTPSNIIASFKKTGIFPFDENAFTDIDFLSSSVTDISDPILESRPEKVQISNNPEPQSINENMTPNRDSNIPKEAAIVSPVAFPKADPRSNQTKGRRKRKSITATDTPEKNEIKEPKTDKNSKVKKMKLAPQSKPKDAMKK